MIEWGSILPGQGFIRREIQANPGQPNQKKLHKEKGSRYANLLPFSGLNGALIHRMLVVRFSLCCHGIFFFFSQYKFLLKPILILEFQNLVALQKLLVFCVCQLSEFGLKQSSRFYCRV